MKTTIEISLKMAMQASEAICDKPTLKSKVSNPYPNVWVIEAENEWDHEQLLTEVLEQLSSWGIYDDEYEYNFEAN